MISNLEKYKKDLAKLIKQGEKMLSILKNNNDLMRFRKDYEIWYSEAFALIKIILPDRLEDFKKYYEQKNNKSLKDCITYTPPRSEAINIDFGEIPAKEVDYARSLFVNQLSIIKSAKKRFESSLFDIKQLLQADLFDSEIDIAKELSKNGFLRAAGAIAGVVLEKHLNQVCSTHNVKIRKKNPNISDYNDALKKENVIEIPDWRFIQRLADLRNLCVHKKNREPTKDEVDELIKGVEKITKTLF